MGGIKTMNKIPEAIFVVGAKEEKNAIKEAKAMGVKIIALVDTNIDPEGIDFPIPANDDAIGSISLITRYLTREIMENKK
jgi:small subunit ribosomal protein S2